MTNNEIILEKFYKEIIPLASTKGVVIVDGIKYHIGFNTIINNEKVKIQDNSLPMLMINNVDLFNELLIKYINSAIKIFEDNKFSYIKEMVCGDKREDQIKYLLITLFSNAREDDFKNPVNFLNMQLDFLKNRQLVDIYPSYTKVANISDIANSSIEVVSKRQAPFLETPYVFSSRLCKEINDSIYYYDLPDISYGISNDTLYIYAIKGKRRNKNKPKTKYEKNINRLLYKINDGVVYSDEYLEYKNNPDSTYYPENIIDVTHSSVVALSVFLSILMKEDLTNIVVVDYLPYRYISKNRKIHSLANNNEDLNNLLLEQDRNQSNMTNKFIRTFMRVNHHLDNMSVIAYPNEIDNSMHLKLVESKINSNNLINNIYNSIYKNGGRHTK